jgi:hypothetical protein
MSTVYSVLRVQPYLRTQVLPSLRFGHRHWKLRFVMRNGE